MLRKCATFTRSIFVVVLSLILDRIKKNGVEYDSLFIDDGDREQAILG
jgi:hypothetical protein